MKMKIMILAAAFSLLGCGAAIATGNQEGSQQRTTVKHTDEGGNRGTTKIRSDGHGSRIQGHAGSESTRETHREAVKRVETDAQNRGEKTQTKPHQ